MLREHQFLHDLASATLARITLRARFSQSGSLIMQPEPLQRNAVWGTFEIDLSNLETTRFSLMIERCLYKVS